LNFPANNQETLEKFLPPDARIVHLRPHPNGHDRIGILFVTDCPLDSVRRFYADNFKQSRFDIDLKPNLCISVFEDNKLPAILAAGNDEPLNEEFVRVFVSEEDWSEARKAGAQVIGVLSIDRNLLPDGINKGRLATASPSPAT